MEPNVSIIALGVRDFARALEVYRDRLGWPVVSEGEDIAFLRVGGVIRSLYPQHLLAEGAGVDGDGFRGFGLAHNVGSKARVDQVLAEPSQPVRGS